MTTLACIMLQLTNLLLFHSVMNFLGKPFNNLPVLGFKQLGRNELNSVE